MTIRNIQEKDRQKLIDMMKVFYLSPALLHHPAAEVIERTVDDCIGDMPYLTGFVAEIDGEIAGYTMLSFGYSTEFGGVSIMIEDLYVLEKFRRNGLGESLLKFIEEKYNCVARLRLEVEPSNTRAIKLYTKMGYKPLNYLEMTKEF